MSNGIDAAMDRMQCASLKPAPDGPTPDARNE
jgi:hypothetical protein